MLFQNRNKYTELYFIERMKKKIKMLSLGLRRNCDLINLQISICTVSFCVLKGVKDLLKCFRTLNFSSFIFIIYFLKLKRLEGDVD